MDSWSPLSVSITMKRVDQNSVEVEDRVNPNDNCAKTLE